MSFTENIVREGVEENLLVTVDVDLFFSQKEFHEVVSGSGPSAIVRKRLPPGYYPVAFGYPEFNFQGQENTTNFDRVEPFTTSISGTQWSYNKKTSDLYATGITAPDDVGESTPFAATTSISTDQNPILIRCRLFYSIRPIQWYADPLDQNTGIVQFEPRIGEDVSYKQSFKDKVYGRLPRFTASFSIDNSDGQLNLLLRQGNFGSAEVKVYRMSGRPLIENTVKIVESRSTGIKRISALSVVISITGSGASLSRPFIPVEDFIGGSGPRRQARRRIILGHARGVRCENENYVNTVSTTQNRQWFLREKLESTLLTDPEALDQSGVTISGDRKSVTNSAFIGKFRCGDYIRIKKDSSEEWRVVNEVDNATGKIGWWTELGSGFTSPVEIFKYMWIERLYFRQGENDILLKPLEDYTIDIFGSAQRYVRIVLANNFESSYGAISTLDPNEDFLWGNFYGPIYDNAFAKLETKVGESEIGRHKNLPAVAHPAAIIWLILFYSVGVDEVDVDSFEDLLGFEPDDSAPCGLVDPETPFSRRRTIEGLINDVAVTFDLLFFRDLNGKLKILRASQGTGVTHTIRDSDIIGEINYAQDHQQVVSSVTAQYHYADIQLNNFNWTSQRRDQTERAILGQSVYGVDGNTNVKAEVVPYDFDCSDTLNQELRDHRVEDDTGPVRVANIAAQRAGAQRNIYKISLPKRFSTIDFGDKVRLISREIGGFNRSSDDNEINCEVVSIARFLDGIELELEDVRLSEITGRATYGYV